MIRWNHLAQMGLVFFVFHSFVAAQSSEHNADARKIFLTGRDLWNQGSFGEAEKSFREALIRYPRAEQSDQTAYYLITTLIKQGRAAEALKEIEVFPRRYPRSPWLSDVQEQRIGLVGFQEFPVIVPYDPPRIEMRVTFQTSYVVVTRELNEIRLHLEYPYVHNFVLHPFVTSDTALRHEVLRVLIENDQEHGIRVAEERFRANPSDPAVVSNLGTIARHNSVQALSFLVSIAGSSIPSVRNQAVYWLSRPHVDKRVLATIFGDLLSERSNQGRASLATATLSRLLPADQRTILEHLLQSGNGMPQVDHIFRTTTNSQLRAQVVKAVASVPGGPAQALLSTAANDRELAVRRSALEALSQRRESEARKAREGLSRTRQGAER